jgi:hypothetical protein
MLRPQLLIDLRHGRLYRGVDDCAPSCRHPNATRGTARGSSMRRLTLWIATALAVPIAAFVAFSATASGSAPAAYGVNTGSCPSPSGNAVVQTVPMPGQPGFMLLTRNTLWVTIAAQRVGGRGRIVRLDARSGRVQRTYLLPVDPYRMAYGFGSLWVAGATTRQTRRYEGAVLRIDAQSGRLVRVIRGPRPLGTKLAATSKAIWVEGLDIVPRGHPERAGVRFVHRIDPRRNAVVRWVRLRSSTVVDLLGDGDALWASGWGGLVKLSDSGRLLFEQRFGGSGWAMTRTPGAVWVAEPWFGEPLHRRQNRPARRLLKVSISGSPRITVIELEAQPGDVSAASGVVWLGIDGLARLRAGETPPTVTRVPVDVAPNRIEAFPGGAWVNEWRRSRNLFKIC